MCGRGGGGKVEVGGGWKRRGRCGRRGRGETGV